MSYENWTTRETWNIALWIDNTQPQYRHWYYLAERHLKAARNKVERLKTGTEAQAIEEAVHSVEWALSDRYGRETPQFEQAVTERNRRGTMFTLSDLTRDELIRVKWREVAEHLVEGAREALEEGSTFRSAA